MVTVDKPLFPLVLADVALFSVEQDRLQVLLTKRARPPAAGRWALPGGILKPALDGSLEEAALRVLRDKVHVDIPHIEQVHTFSGPSRDERGWSVTVLFYALLPRDRVQAAVSPKVEAVRWAEVADPGVRLAFDHEALLAAAVGALQNKVLHNALPLHLLPERFTLTELQRTCEAVLGRPLDKSAFRRRLKAYEDLVEVPGEFVRGVQRPAQLYRAAKEFQF
jgi:8-oxo-dGTP diphosphatase